MNSAEAYVSWKTADPDLDDEDFVPHPSEVCEPANLAATEGPPLYYTLKSYSPNLSTLQRETIRAIMISLHKRNAFLLGDATGVGKGRILAGLILEYTSVIAWPNRMGMQTRAWRRMCTRSWKRLEHVDQAFDNAP